MAWRKNKNDRGRTKTDPWGSLSHETIPDRIHKRELFQGEGGMAGIGSLTSSMDKKRKVLMLFLINFFMKTIFLLP